MNTIFTYKNISFILCSLILLSLIFSSCDPTKRSQNGNGLDPISSNNTTAPTTKDTTKAPVAVVPVPPRIDTLRWCDTLQQNPNTLVVVCFEKIGTGSIKADTVDVIQVIDDTMIAEETTYLDSTINKKAAYKVAIIMPFRSKNFNPSPSKEIPGYSLKAIEFYEGVKIALDSLEKEGVRLFVDVYDSMGDTSVVKQLLEKPSMKEMDLIVGPIRSNTLSIVAEFAKQNQTPLVSPFNNRTDLTANNPYYLQVNPSFEVHSKTIINNIYNIKQKDRYRQLDKQVLLLSERKDSSSIYQLQKDFGVYTNTYDTLLPQYMNSNANIKINFIRPFLNRSKLNIIVIPSTNEEFVYNSLRELQSLVDKLEPAKGYQIAVVGRDRWKYYSRIGFEYYESLHLHFTSEAFISKKTNDNIRFYNGYKNTYGIAPREFGYVGFDVMLYFGRMLHEYGTNFPAYLMQKPSERRHTSFQLRPVYSTSAPLDASMPAPTPMIRGFENQYLNFLKFEDYTVQKAN
jgi:hypothetical protein